jgi:iron complex transport system substrate-binding protein
LPFNFPIISLMRFFNFLCALLALGVLPACTTAPESTPPKVSIAVSFPKDDLGREVNLQAPAQHVVCIGPGATETIFALGAQSKLVGRDQISDYPAATKNIPIVGDYVGPSVEKVIALRPDLVIIQGETYDKARVENWQQKIGAPVATLVPLSVEQTRRGIEKIAAWLGANEKLAALTKGFRTLPVVKSKSGTAFYEVQRSPLWTAGKGTLIADEMKVLGLENVAHDITSYKAFNIEVLLKSDPDFYIVTMENPDYQKALRELRSTPALKNLSAIRTGRVLVADANLVLRPGPRLPLGIQSLAKEIKAALRTQHSVLSTQHSALKKG